MLLACLQVSTRISHSIHRQQLCQKVNYLTSTVQRRFGLRSASRDDLVIPASKSKFGERSFAVGGPSVWNALPESVRTAKSINIFKYKLKTHLFELSYDTYGTLNDCQSALVFG